MECTETIYIEGADSLKESLARMDTIIAALELRLIDSATGTANIEEYEINDGQTKIRTKYTTVESIAKAIKAFEGLRQTRLNKLNGRGMVLRTWRGL